MKITKIATNFYKNVDCRSVKFTTYSPTKHLLTSVSATFKVPYLHQFSAVVQIFFFLLLFGTNLKFI